MPRIATAFGGGIAGHGEVCGAVSGAAMAIGLKCGRDSGDDLDAKAETYAKVEQFTNAFREKFGSIICRELIGCDLRTPEGSQAAKERNLHLGFCSDIVAFAAEEALKLLIYTR